MKLTRLNLAAITSLLLLPPLTGPAAAEGTPDATTPEGRPVSLLQAGERMAPTQRVILRHDPSYISTLRVPPPPELALQQQGLMAVQATISINYLPAGPGQGGDTCAAWPDQPKAAFTYAANLWASQLQSPVPITIDACWANNLSPGVLGQAGANNFFRNFSGAPVTNTWYSVPAANALHGSDLDPAESDIYSAFNSTFSWYFGTDGNTPPSQVDFASVVLHEITHGLGFLGSMQVSGSQGSWGFGTGSPIIYDRFTENGSGQKLLDTTLFPNPSAVLKTQLTSNDLYFNGANANAGNGGARVPLYAPATWQQGSSYSHLAESYNNTPNALMTFALPSGESIHSPGPVTLGLLKDLGWTLQSASSSLLLAGLNSNGQIYYTPNLTNWTQIGGQLNRILIGDLNQDGQNDLVGLASNGTIWYTTNLNNWTNIPGALSRIVAGDFNGDGKTDLAGLASNGSIWYTTNLSSWTQIPGGLSQLVAGDFDGNGRSDLAGLASNGSIWYTTNLNNWTNIPGGLSQLVAGDFDGNGRSDLAGLASNSSIWYTTNLNTWTQIPGGLSQLVAGNLNGDSADDLAGLASNGSIWYTTNRSTWTQIPGGLSQLVAGNLNGDSAKDLAGLASNGSIWYTTNLNNWTNIPGQLATLAAAP